MEGFDYDCVKIELKIPGGFRVEAMAAVGEPGERNIARKFAGNGKP
jgi:hypothetical protein